MRSLPTGFSSLLLAAVVACHCDAADDAKQTPLTVEELSGEWSAQTDLMGLKSQMKRDPLDEGVRPVDVSVNLEIRFDQSKEAISRFAQFRLQQVIDHSKGCGRIGLAGRLSDREDESGVNLVFHYTQNGSHVTQARTVGTVHRSDSDSLVLTLFPTESGIFDLGLDNLAPVQAVKLGKRDVQEQRGVTTP